MQVDNYRPPVLRDSTTKNLNERFKEFVAFWKDREKFDLNYFQRLRSVLTSAGDITPYKSIASATTIKPLRRVQPVSGTNTVATISAPTGFVELVLLSLNGFALNTAGNIAAARTIDAGTCCLLYFNLGDSKWYAN
jgi:hypothetical protein